MSIIFLPGSFIRPLLTSYRSASDESAERLRKLREDKPEPPKPEAPTPKERPDPVMVREFKLHSFDQLMIVAELATVGRAIARNPAAYSSDVTALRHENSPNPFTGEHCCVFAGELDQPTMDEWISTCLLPFCDYGRLDEDGETLLLFASADLLSQMRPGEHAGYLKQRRALQIPTVWPKLDLMLIGPIEGLEGTIVVVRHRLVDRLMEVLKKYPPPYFGTVSERV